MQAILEIVGLIVVLCALVPPVAAAFFHKPDEVDLRPPLQRPPKRYRGRFTNHDLRIKSKLKR